jgi:hypothetical protein
MSVNEALSSHTTVRGYHASLVMEVDCLLNEVSSVVKIHYY